MRRIILMLLLATSTAATAAAQTGKHFSVGMGMHSSLYTDSRFSSNSNGLGFIPMYHFSRSSDARDGWRWETKATISFSGVDVPTNVAGSELRLGKMSTIPLLLGVTRAYCRGPMKVGAYVAGGPSFNNFEIDAGTAQAYQSAGSSLDAIHAKTSFAFRPGVSASYDLSSWLALQGTTGCLATSHRSQRRQAPSPRGMHGTWHSPEEERPRRTIALRVFN